MSYWVETFTAYKKTGRSIVEMTAKLNKLLAYNQINQDEYDEILELINNV